MGDQNNGSGLLTREQILAAASSISIDVASMAVKELGGTIYVRGMSAKEYDRMNETYRKTHRRRDGTIDQRDFSSFIVSRLIVNAKGERLLNDADADVIAKLPAGVVDRIVGKSRELSGWTEDEGDELGQGSESEEA